VLQANKVPCSIAEFSFPLREKKLVAGLSLIPQCYRPVGRPLLRSLPPATSLWHIISIPISDFSFCVRDCVSRWNSIVKDSIYRLKASAGFRPRRFTLNRIPKVVFVNPLRNLSAVDHGAR
jgi:hypothetical protein